MKAQQYLPERAAYGAVIALETAKCGAVGVAGKYALHGVGVGIDKVIEVLEPLKGKAIIAYTEGERISGVIINQSIGPTGKVIYGVDRLQGKVLQNLFGIDEEDQKEWREKHGFEDEETSKIKDMYKQADERAGKFIEKIPGGKYLLRAEEAKGDFWRHVIGKEPLEERVEAIETSSGNTIDSTASSYLKETTTSVHVPGIPSETKQSNVQYFDAVGNYFLIGAVLYGLAVGYVKGRTQFLASKLVKVFSIKEVGKNADKKM